MLFRHASFRVSSRERAEELVQDAYMKTWDHVVRGGSIENWKAFLFRVLNNLIIDEYRKKKSTSLDALLEQETVSEGSFDDLQTGGREEVERTHDVQFDTALLEKALAELRPNDRDIIVYRYIDELSPRDIARMLSETENVVSVRIHRALARLRLAFKKHHVHV